ncbi:MAG: DNA-3-methyladenine glycosylase 2 family protein [Candidatus Marinimicrobia bacterium]|nr:DNA-3-methyladenine glycosylase 2 family protein [Candidatus Neomarinimicrobiota bacterium]MBL7110237.1 DNA-3-methyladenine glycosylase 2 family protein [Candidatus Neomarinimicrobiota bacterium]
MFEKEIQILKERDSVLSDIIDKVGKCTIKLNPNAFDILIESIIHQQLSMKAARTILGRFRSLFSNKSFPTPKQVLRISDENYRKVGLSKQKLRYIKDCSVKFSDGTITPDKFMLMSDEEIIQHLIQVKGIGSWTAEMFLIFSLGRPNVFPLDDLGIQKAISNNYNLEPKKLNFENIRKLWSPYCTPAIWYMWETID